MITIPSPLFWLVSAVVAIPLTGSNASKVDSARVTAPVDLPLLKLPYGTWQASKYEASSDVYTFKNIRFAAPPVGPLRWAKPAPPANVSTLQNGSVGGTCYQSLPPSMLYLSLVGGLAPAAQSDGSILGGIGTWLQDKAMPLIGGLVNNYPSFLTTIANQVKNQDVGKLMGGDASSEDCLFLDLFVPGKAFKSPEKLPVINYIYGGAFIVGAKDGMYDGTPLVKQSSGNVIVVVGNYRLGAFGFLAGPTVEREGTPNAGFWDQRATLEWIHQNIHLVNGDPDNLSVWGESAGAGSIMHHLTAFGGKKPSLFRKAIIQSPANRAQWDRRGQVEEQFKKFEAATGCTGKGLACMRGQPTKTIKDAADSMIGLARPGEYEFGPAVDGDFSRQLPDLEFASGNFAKDVESVIITHTSNEGIAFVEDKLKNNKTFFEEGVRNLWTTDPKIQAAIMQAYPPSSPSSKFKDEKARMVDYMTNQFFACHVRSIASAYKEKAYVGQYSRKDGAHGRDIAATFYNNTKKAPSSDPTFAPFAAQYEDYLLWHARAGDPNASKQTPQWPKVEFAGAMGNVMEAGNKGFGLIKDSIATKENCELWMNVMSAVTSKGGYIPESGWVASTLV